MVVFNVTVDINLIPIDSHLFVSGSDSILGSWQPTNSLKFNHIDKDSYSLNVVIKTPFFYRYFIGYFKNGILLIRYWEKFSRKCQLNLMTDIYGIKDEIIINDFAWLTDTCIQLKINMIKYQKNQNFLLSYKSLNQYHNVFEISPNLNKINGTNIIQYNNGEYHVFQIFGNSKFNFYFQVTDLESNKINCSLPISIDTENVESMLVFTQENYDKRNFNLPLYDNGIDFYKNSNSDIIPTGYIYGEYMVIKPFVCKVSRNLELDAQNDYLGDLPLDIGHRGMGISYGLDTLSPYIENTIASFKAAYAQGSTFVEFDVQVSKDGIPVIYHDFGVVANVLKFRHIANMELGRNSDTIFNNIDLYLIGIHQLTFEQLNTWKLNHQTILERLVEILCNHHHLHNSGVNNLHHTISKHDFENIPGDAFKMLKSITSPILLEKVQKLYDSTILSTQSTCPTFSDLTRTFDTENVLSYQIGNGESVQNAASNVNETKLCVFPSLELVLNNLDPNIGFNVELKYPLIYEDNTHESPDGQYIDLNVYCDNILRLIFDSSHFERKIIFSSFHPQICQMIKWKQSHYPVYMCFCNTKGKNPFFMDPLTKDINLAIKFCVANKLAGFSISALTLLREPEICDMARELNLKLIVWGKEASDAETRLKLAKLGVQGIIHDRTII